MQFVDNVTPTNPQQYMNAVQNYSGRGNDRRRQLSSDWATMYYQNAYQTAMLNYMNQWNSPENQMLRYQRAGISPWLVGQDPGNMPSAPSGAAPQGKFVAPSTLDQFRGYSGALTNVMQESLKLYDYLQYGSGIRSEQLKRAPLETHNLGLQGESLSHQLRRYSAEADFAEWWNRNPGGLEDSRTGSPSSNSPRATYMELSTNRLAAQISQLESMVSMLYPSQVAANKARTALDAYKTQILHGQKDVILNIDTGHPQVDSILKGVLFFLTDSFKF